MITTKAARSVRSSIAAAMLGYAVLGLASILPASPASAQSAQVRQALSCGNQSAMVLQFGMYGLSARGSASCSTNNPNRRICMTTRLLKGNAVVSSRSGCRSGGGALNVGTPVINRNGPASAYRADQSIYAP